MRYEFFSAAADITATKPLALLGDEEIPAGQYALSFGDDVVVIIQGTASQIEAFASRLLSMANDIVRDAAAPLTHADFAWHNEDGCYRCPRCDEIFPIHDADPVVVLVQQIDAHIDSHRPAHER